MKKLKSVIGKKNPFFVNYDILPRPHGRGFLRFLRMTYRLSIRPWADAHGFLKSRYRLLVPVLILVSVGLLAILDVSAPKAVETFSDRFYFAKQQFFWILIGFTAYFIFSAVNIRLWEKYALHLMALSVFFLILVLIPQIGTKTLGARRWLDFGFFNFQPSEFAKLVMCIYLAKLATLKKSLASYVLPVIVVCGLVIFQPDLGTSIVIAFIATIQIFVSEVPLVKFIALTLVGAVLAILLIFTSDYRRERVVSFIDPFSQSGSDNYHVKQALYSLAIGGVGGTGVGQSKQKYLFLPEATTDSIFAVISEETGFIGSTIIVLIYFYISLQMLGTASKISEVFPRVLALGLFAWFTGQTLVNLGSISSLIPFTGVPLPLISYGGSTLLSLLIGLGMFNAIVKQYG